MLPGHIGTNIPILRVVFPERVFFDTDSTVLRPGAVEIAEIIAESLRNEPPDVVMFVAGHADARADRAYNLGLSIGRANALAEDVLARGVNVASIWRVGFGEDLPLIAGDSDYAYGQNRRIEFLFAARPEALAQWLAGEQVLERCQGRTRRETEQCRIDHPIAPRYTVDEVRTPVRARLVRTRPTPTPKVGIDPWPGRGAAAAPSAGRQTAADPWAAPGAVSMPVRGPGTALNLRRARRIQLHPTRGSGGALYTQETDTRPDREE